MNTVFNYITFALILLVGYSCSKNTEDKTITDNLPYFDSLIINSYFDVFLKEDSIFKLEIKGQEKQIDDITYAVTDGVLSITNQRKQKYLTPSKNKIEIYVYSKPLRFVNAKETCFIRTLNPITSDEFGLILDSKANTAELELNCETFYTWNVFPCGGKLTLSGESRELKIWNHALMEVDAQNLDVSDYILVENNSKGDCTVNTSAKLEYLINGSGNIISLKNPSIIVNKGVNSTGKLILH